jgi:predicted ATPase/DNA-binding winged helix-turn-helix (wHTH) protein
VYESGEWEVDLTRRELRAHGVLVPIGGRAFEILEVLVQSAGELVTKRDLMDRVWPGAIVEDNTLQFHISAIRKALGPDRGMLKTASGRGYRLVGGWVLRRENTSSVDAIDLEPVRSTAEPFQTNVPAAGFELVGRSIAVQHLHDLLSAYRVVTLTGPGGIGKTRLAFEVARGLFPNFQGDVRLVELISVSNPVLVPSAVTAALGLELGGDEISAESVARAVGSKRLLLVLDNCEHVIDAAAKLAETIVSMCSRTTILATSREILKIQGEYVYRVAPLDVPLANEEPGNILAHSAVQLFVATTRALHSEFSPDRESLPAIAAICRRLDGIPLAIDLAATRVATLGLQQVAAGLDDRLGMLTAGRRTALPRHQTLRATLDWSYELLTELERVIMRRLSIFAGDFTAEAARLVAAGSEITALEVISSLANLVTKSLVTFEGGSAIGHYRLHETTRAYAREKLVESRETERTARRHAEYFRDLFERAEGEWETRRTTEWLAAYARHIDDLRAALDWAYTPQGDAAVGGALTVAAVPLWFQLSLINECRGRIERALATLGPLESGGGRRKMQLYAALGWSMMYTTTTARETGAAWTTALELAEGLGDADYRLRALWGLWAGSVNNGEFPAALALASRFRSLAATMTDPADLPVGDRMIGVSLHFLGDQTGARRHIELMLDRYISRDYRSDAVRFQFDQRVTANITLARVLWLQGFADQAMRNVKNNIDRALSVSHTLSLCNALAQAACPIALSVGDLPAAERFTAMLIDYAGRHALDIWHLYGKGFRGQLLIGRGDIDVGLRLLGAAIDELRKAKFVQYLTAFLGAFAEALAGAGRIAQGLAAIEEALAQSERNEERWCVPEFLRIKGELILREGSPQAVKEAEQHFRHSIDWARQQGVLLWELRTSTSLARLQQDQHRIAEARSLLQSAYDRFSEGFETADLKTANALLNSLQ